MPAATNFNTPQRCIKTAMKDAGLLGEGDEPNSDDYAQYLPKLSDIINTLQTDGLKLFVNGLVTVTLTASVGTYTLGPGGVILASKPARIIEGYYLDVNSISRPLDPLSWNTYNTLSDKTTPGAITSFFANKQATNVIVYLYQIPDATAATGTVVLLAQQQITNPITLTEQLAFPAEWFLALRWLLADDICGGQSQAIMERCRGKAIEFKTKLEDWDVEDASTWVTPNLMYGNRNPFSRR